MLPQQRARGVAWRPAAEAAGHQRIDVEILILPEEIFARVGAGVGLHPQGFVDVVAEDVFALQRSRGVAFLDLLLAVFSRNASLKRFAGSLPTVAVAHVRFERVVVIKVGIVQNSAARGIVIIATKVAIIAIHTTQTIETVVLVAHLRCQRRARKRGGCDAVSVRGKTG